MPLPLMALLGLPLLACVVLALWRSRAGGPARAWARAAGWVALAALPAVAAQAAGGGRGSHQVELLEMLAWLPLVWWVHLGGHSVRLLFEATVGPRQVTMFGDLGSFLLLVLVQALLLAGLVAWRWKRSRRLFDPVILLVLLAVAGNAWANLGWTWWGT